jgi:uncharacterized protein YcbK (DUF882 family)
MIHTWDPTEKKPAGYLTDNFNRSEFACPDECGFDTVDAELITVLENLRSALRNRPITITSGCRCFSHNEHVQLQANPKYIPGTSNSIHMDGKAADIKVEGVSPGTVADCLEMLYPGKYGIGRYKSWTHIDIRTTQARW